MKEFLFGNIQIGFKSQGLLYKVSCGVRTPHETQSYSHYQTKIIFWEWGRERRREKYREERDWWNPVYKPVLRISPLLYVTVCASFLFWSLCLCCVPLLSFSISAFFFFSSLVLLFFFFLCVTLSIYREIPKKLFPYFLSTDQLMEQFALVFLSTTPNFVFSRAHYSAFLLFLFVPSHFKFPLFRWWHLHFSTFQAHFPHFLVMPFPISHFTFLFYLFCFYLFLSIGSRQQTTHVAFIFIFIFFS